MITQATLSSAALIALLYFVKRYPTHTPTLISMATFAFLGSCVGLVGFGVVDFNVSDFASEQFDGTNFVMLPRPLWAALWLSLPASTQFWLFPIVFSLIGALYGYTHPPHLRKGEALT